MREISETLELQVLKQAMEIIRQRRGNECHNDVVCGKHSAVNYQASQVYGLHMQGPKEKIRCKALHTKFGHPRQRRVSSQGGLYSMRGKDGSGDKPKPKPQPIDPGQGR
ncbi:uncharacterized protein K444DRAFT_630402 [Hyaloscypha bicolor E]|uniref:Uncharacterized protein n=1 Tax=Hyaloscypha bicolor E TaxID=1095630 RepID=A0A2J6T6R0_9HELO|nr:uncharacterized protein K444DRAFT_630402 [Hyaloscypha bicolor E]PMD58709.1 hypothetical protein K444DRAFT_630402 [Hyaloscypha bicolor E]